LAKAAVERLLTLMETDGPLPPPHLRGERPAPLK
jgi:hypothetical protein